MAIELSPLSMVLASLILELSSPLLFEKTTPSFDSVIYNVLLILLIVITSGGIEIQPLNAKSPLRSMLINKSTEIDSGSILACAITKKSRSGGKYTQPII